jgi:hypothetical protein
LLSTMALLLAVSGIPRSAPVAALPSVGAQAGAVPAGILTAVTTPTTSDAAPTVAPLAASVVSEQVRVVTRDYQVPVTRGQDDVASEQAGLDDAQATLTADTTAAQADATAVTTMTATLATDTASHTAAVAAHRAAEATLTADRSRLRAVAVALYIGPPESVSSSTADVAAAQQADAAVASLSIAEQRVGADVRTDVSRAGAAGSRQAHLAAVVAGDTASLAGESERATAAAAAATAQQVVLAGAEQTLSTAQASLVAAQQAQAAAVAAVTTASAPGTATAAGLAAVGPSILGPSALTAGQLSGWFAQSGYEALTSATIDQLIGWYLSDGAVEGVRGDLAFAQAVLETGGFASTDAVTINNYAGVGHCDTCATGLAFPSPEAGVIGQLQLLRIFADTSTVDGLPQPLASASLAPGSQSSLGCCTTWPSLTGVWATDPDYGQKILTIYARMLAYALTAPPAAPSAGAAP